MRLRGLRDPDAPPPVHLTAAAVGMVFIGGAVGTLCRYGVGLLLPWHDGRLPWATLIVNLAGAAILGIVLHWVSVAGPDSGWRRRTRLIAGTGFCGALTTYSSFALDSIHLFRGGYAGMAVGYIAITIVGGLVTAAAGWAVAGRFAR